MSDELRNAVKAALIAGNPQLVAQLLFDAKVELNTGFVPAPYRETPSGLRWAVGISRYVGGSFNLGIDVQMVINAGIEYKKLIQRAS